MPGHIFARLGMWPDDISTNLASVQASKLAEKDHLEGVSHEMHAYEFLLYAYLQEGSDSKADQIYKLVNPTIAHLKTVPGIQDDGMFVFLGYFAAELEDILRVPVKEPLLRLVEQDRIARQTVSGLYLYCASNPRTRPGASRTPANRGQSIRHRKLLRTGALKMQAS